MGANTILKALLNGPMLAASHGSVDASRPGGAVRSKNFLKILC